MLVFNYSQILLNLLIYLTDIWFSSHVVHSNLFNHLIATTYKHFTFWIEYKDYRLKFFERYFKFKKMGYILILQYRYSRKNNKYFSSLIYKYKTPNVFIYSGYVNRRRIFLLEIGRPPLPLSLANLYDRNFGCA